MTAYTKTTNFAAKDSLLVGNPNKIIKGTEHNVEYTNIATAVNSKANTSSPTFTGTANFANIASGAATGLTLDNSVIGGSTPAAATFSTFTLPTGATVTAILDEDDMVSNSATALATQQSSKAYVDAQLIAANSFSGALAAGNTSGTNNVIITTGQQITTDTISETTAAAGVTVDGVLIKDGEVDGVDVSTLVSATSANVVSGLNTATDTIQFSKGADVASATGLTLGTDGNYFDVTGTTTIATIDTVAVGTVVKLHFDAILTLTNSADLVLPSGADISTAAGDEAEFVEYATGDWRCTGYQKANGEAVVSPTDVGSLVYIGTVTATAATNVDIESIDSTYDNYFIKARGAAMSAGNTLNIRYKLAGAYVTTSTYRATTVFTNTAEAFIDTGIYGTVFNFQLFVSDVNSSSIKYVEIQGSGVDGTSLYHGSKGGNNTGTGALTGIRLYGSSGATITGEFDLYGIKNS
jgi:ribosomal protein L12E/L44/L45/RPP1/RPP2